MKIVIGFITYNNLTSKYLPFFVPSLKEALAETFGDYETEKNYRILAVDNSDDEVNENSVYLKDNFPEIELDYAGSNLGFAKAYNRMISRAGELGADYFLMINPDTLVDFSTITELIEALDENPKLGAIAPRILRWDFASNTRTTIIDSDGLFITASHRFSDRHQGLEALDCEPEMVFGFTGAAALIRMQALREIAYDNHGHIEYLDELMFMYKEDVDLSYRLQLAGWPTESLPSAYIYHDRTASPLGESLRQIIRNRKNKSRAVKRWSFLNHWILVLKYSHLDYSFRVKWKTWRYQLFGLFFALFFETYLLKELRTLWQKRAEIKLKRQSLRIAINPRKIEEMMEK